MPKKNQAVEANPRMAKPEPAQPRAGSKAAAKVGWCRFQAVGRCYVEGCFLEAPNTNLDRPDETLYHEIVLSPAAAYRQRKNKMLQLVSGTIPELADGMTVDDLEDGDPKLGTAPAQFKLLKSA